MRLQYVILDETVHAGDEFARKLRGGRIKSAYLFDAESATYLCELTPSHELHLIDTWAEPKEGDEFSEEEREEFYEALLPTADDGVTYMHVSDVRAKGPRDVKHDPEDSFDDILADCVANCGAYQA
jgi:hypothetical protein